MGSSYNKIEIGAHIIKDICYTGDGNDIWAKVQSKITSSDIYDGGGTHEVILREKLTGNFYQLTYTDWEIGYDGNGDGLKEDKETGLTKDNGVTISAWQVYPKEVVMTVYSKDK